MTTNVLLVGDIVGKPGREAVKGLLPDLRKEFEVDLVVANAENATNGRGISLKHAEDLLTSGVDVLTSGNHVWDQKEIIPYMNGELPLIRPINYPEGVPGRGYQIVDGIMVVNAMGRTFMMDIECPFRAMDRLLNQTDLPRIIIVDFHAEASSEKVAMGWYLDGRVSAVCGTHTHVPTADLRVLPRGTAYVSDIGMTGPVNSIIGNEVDAVISRFLTAMPKALPVAEGPSVLNAVLVQVNRDNGQGSCIRRVSRAWE